MKNIKIGNRSVAIYGSKFEVIPGDVPANILIPDIKWLLRDEFTTSRAAGSVNGTNAEPGPGVRVINDSTGLLSVLGGKAVVGGATVGVNDPSRSYGSIARTPGLMFLGNLSTTTTGATTSAAFGFYTEMPVTGSSNHEGVVLYLNAETGHRLYIGASNPTATMDSPLVKGTFYKHIIVLRASGIMWFFKSGSTFRLNYVSPTGSTATLYPAIVGLGAGRYDFDTDFIRIPTNLWLPTPLLSDGFGSIFGLSDGLGHAEGIAGGLGSGGGGVTWTARLGTWANAAGVASCTALDGGASIGIATATLTTADVLYSCVLGYSAGAGGVIVRYTDAANYVYAINDGTNVKLFEVTTASAYPGTQRGTAVKAPAAGARLIVDVSGAASRVYYNEVLIFTYASIADTTGKTIGLITNNIGNTFNDAVAYTKGTGGEYSILDRFSRD